MSQVTFSVKIMIDSEPATGLSVLLSDPTGSFGIKRNDTDAVVVEDSVAMIDTGGGYYSYSFDQSEPELSYTGWIEYTYGSQQYHYSNVFSGEGEAVVESESGSAVETVICYEDRSQNFRTSAWKLGGINTSENTGNTIDGKLWLKMARSENTVNISLHKTPSALSGDTLASASVDISLLESNTVDFIDVELNAAVSSSLSGCFRLYEFIADGVCCVQAVLCSDAELAMRYEGLKQLSAYDENYGMSSIVCAASDEVLSKLSQIFAQSLGRESSRQWWHNDFDDIACNLQQIQNPHDLKKLCAFKSLEIALRRDHVFSGESHYNQLADCFAEKFTDALSSLSLCLSDSSAIGSRRVGQNVLRQSRA